MKYHKIKRVPVKNAIKLLFLSLLPWGTPVRPSTDLVLWEQAPLKLVAVAGTQARPYLEDLVRLNLVFKEEPYTYEGTPEDDAAYFEAYFTSPRSSFLFLINGTNVVGYSAAIALEDELAEIRQPIAALKEADPSTDDINAYLYFGGIVIEKEYRHKKAGIIDAMHRHYENFAQMLGRKYVIAAIIERETAKPQETLAARFRFERMAGVAVKYAWRDSATHEMTDVSLGIWRKAVAVTK